MKSLKEVCVLFPAYIAVAVIEVFPLGLVRNMGLNSLLVAEETVS